MLANQPTGACWQQGLVSFYCSGPWEYTSACDHFDGPVLSIGVQTDLLQFVLMDLRGALIYARNLPQRVSVVSKMYELIFSQVEIALISQKSGPPAHSHTEKVHLIN